MLPCSRISWGASGSVFFTIALSPTSARKPPASQGQQPAWGTVPGPGRIGGSIALLQGEAEPRHRRRCARRDVSRPRNGTRSGAAGASASEFDLILDRDPAKWAVWPSPVLQELWVRQPGFDA